MFIPGHEYSPLCLEEREQIRVDLVLVGGAQPVRCAGIDLELCLRRDLHRRLGLGADRHNLVVVAVDEERRHGHLLEILGLVRLGEHLNAVEDAFETGLHPLEPE
jgi:hypothetical protein